MTLSYSTGINRQVPGELAFDPWQPSPAAVTRRNSERIRAAIPPATRLAKTDIDRFYAQGPSLRIGRIDTPATIRFKLLNSGFNLIASASSNLASSMSPLRPKAPARAKCM